MFERQAGSGDPLGRMVLGVHPKAQCQRSSCAKCPLMHEPETKESIGKYSPDDRLSECDRDPAAGRRILCILVSCDSVHVLTVAFYTG